MENKTKLILAAVVIGMLLIVSALIYQQKTILSLKKGYEAASSQKETSVNNASTVRNVRENITDNTKELVGNISEISNDSLIIEAEVADVAKLASAQEEDLMRGEDSLPKIKKKFKITLNDQTQYFSMKFQDLEVGMKVSVSLGESVYKSDSPIATSIKVLTAKEASKENLEGFIKSQKKITGQVKEVGENFYVFEVRWFDFTKISDIKNFDHATAPTITKAYKVIVNDKTVYINEKGSLKVGDNGVAYSDKPTFSTTGFTATKIEGPIQLQ